MGARLLTLIFALWVISPGVVAADDPLMGTWQLNLTKSKFKPGPPPTSLTHTFEPDGDNGVKFASDGDAQGKPTRSEFTANYDGTDYTVTGDPAHDSVSLQRINASTIEVTTRRRGKVMWVSRCSVSTDGNTLTITQKGENAQGQKMDNTLVFDKQ
ncbi:MAG: hypothetical protein HY647_08295 [Acidobacteria bacterium]|nr:hypothetical protein [Acidobacteriota bacterium]